MYFPALWTFGFRHSFRWVFIAADVKQAILGADFLQYFGMTVYMRRHTPHVSKWIDYRMMCQRNLQDFSILSKTRLTSYLFSLSFPHELKHVPLTALLSTSSNTSKLLVHPFLRALFLPVSVFAWQECDHMLHLGIVHPSSALHMVPKHIPGDWRPCDDFWAFIDTQSHLQDFTASLQKLLFSLTLI